MGGPGARRPGAGVLGAGEAGAVSGELTPLGSVAGTVLDGAESVAVSPDGKHVYVASSFSDAVAWFGRDKKTGELTFLGCVSGQGSDPCTAASVAGHGAPVSDAVRFETRLGEPGRKPPMPVWTTTRTSSSSAAMPAVFPAGTRASWTSPFVLTSASASPSLPGAPKRPGSAAGRGRHTPSQRKKVNTRFVELFSEKFGADGRQLPAPGGECGGCVPTTVSETSLPPSLGKRRRRPP